MHSILSPVDFSETSRHALRRAGALAARSHARLTVLSVVDPLLAKAARTRLGHDLAKEDTEPALRAFAAETWPGGIAPAVPTTFKTPIGDPVDAILATATSEAVDLIVMGTQGLGGLRKWLLGSTTERLLRRTHVPVLAVPSGEAPGGPPEGDPDSVTRIVVATDFSAPSVAALTYATALASQLSATLTLTHAVEPLTVPPHLRPFMDVSDETRLVNARTRLTALAEQHCQPHPCEVIASVGSPADVISSIAAERRAQLIVMGLSGDQGTSAPSPGSIAYRVLCSTTVPVLVVPAVTTPA